MADTAYDTAYDVDALRRIIADKGAIAVIPSNPSRAQKHPLDKQLYAQRHLIECCFPRLKQFRRVATRFEKTARNYLAVAARSISDRHLRLERSPRRLSPMPQLRVRDSLGPAEAEPG